MVWLSKIDQRPFCCKNMLLTTDALDAQMHSISGSDLPLFKYISKCCVRAVLLKIGTPFGIGVYTTQYCVHRYLSHPRVAYASFRRYGHIGMNQRIQHIYTKSFKH